MAAFPHPFDDLPARLRLKTSLAYLLLIAANLAAWLWAFAAFADHPALLGTAFLAYVFGLRHAVDADHIAAIDNVVRKLMQEGKRPLSVGFFFSLGHSTVVILAAAAIAATAAALQGQLDAVRDVGGVIGTSVSALFLLAIGLANLSSSGASGGPSTACARAAPWSRRTSTPCWPARPAGAPVPAAVQTVSASWHMYPLGFLFGLGFDTATEIGLLGISAAAGGAGHVALVDAGVPGAVHRRHGAGRHHRQRADGGRLRLGVRQPAAQALVQPDDHRRLGRWWRC